MAALATNDASIEPVVAGEIIIVSPADVVIGARLRPIDPVFAEGIGRSMVRDGQINPIDVCRLPGSATWHLAGPGGHRLTGAMLVGMNGIEARVVSANAANRQRREAVENFFRRANDPIERAAALAQLVRLHKERVGFDPGADGRKASIDVRWKRKLKDEASDTNDTMTLVYGWSQDVADQLGLSKRTVERDLMLYRRLVPSLISILRNARHPVASNSTQLHALAKLDDVRQARVVDMLVAGTFKSVGDAIKAIENRPVPAPDIKRLAAVLGTIARMGSAERLGLFQSPDFHALLPAEARRLLAPMLRDGGDA